MDCLKVSDFYVVSLTFTELHKSSISISEFETLKSHRKILHKMYLQNLSPNLVNMTKKEMTKLKTNKQKKQKEKPHQPFQFSSINEIMI